MKANAPTATTRLMRRAKARWHRHRAVMVMAGRDYGVSVGDTVVVGDFHGRLRTVEREASIAHFLIDPPHDLTAALIVYDRCPSCRVREPGQRGGACAGCEWVPGEKVRRAEAAS